MRQRTRGGLIRFTLTRDEIEHEIENYDLSWARADEHKASWIAYTLKGVSITNESDLAENGKVPSRVERQNGGRDDSLTCLNWGHQRRLVQKKAEKNKALLQSLHWLRNGLEAGQKKGWCRLTLIDAHRTYIRFRTPFMDKLIPDADGTKSGWNITNHYFYEIVNRTGNSTQVYNWLSVQRKMPQGQLELSDRINEIYPSKYDKQGWQWRTPFRTETISFDDLADKDAFFTKLDESLQRIWEFEEDLQKKLQ